MKPKKLLVDKNGTIEIPVGIEIIESRAFNCRKDIQKIILPNGLIKIEDSAFNACHNLKEIKVRVLSPNHPQAYEAGGTLLKIGSKYNNIRFDVGSNSLFHMNIQLTKTVNYHIPIGVLGSGLFGGLAHD